MTRHQFFPACPPFVNTVYDWLMMTLERRRDLITVLVPYFLPKRLHSTKSYFIKAIDHTFYGFTGGITHEGCWENPRKACKSRAEGEWFTSFSSKKRKPIESVVYCLIKLALLNWMPLDKYWIKIKKNKMAATTTLRTRSKFRPLKIRLHCRLLLSKGFLKSFFEQRIFLILVYTLNHLLKVKIDCT